MEARTGGAHNFSETLYNAGLFRLNSKPGCPEDHKQHKQREEQPDRTLFELPPNTLSVFLDLLCYHFYFAETLMGEELIPPPEDSLPQQSWWETPLLRSTKYSLVPFAYEILDLLEMEEMQLEEIVSLFRPVGSVALFMRRNNEVFCESLGEEMLRLLQQSDGHHSPRDIFAGSVSRATGEELVDFAVSEGLLLPPGPSVT